MDDFSNREGFTELEVQGAPLEDNVQDYQENNISIKSILKKIVLVIISILIIAGLVDITISIYKIIRIVIPQLGVFLVLLLIVFIMITQRIKE